MGFRALLVGAGFRGRQWLNELGKHPEWECVAAVDPAPAARAELTGTDLAVMSQLDEADALELDAVIVVTPPDLHFEPAMWAVERGLGLLVEKPFTRSLSEAAQLVSKADANNVPIVVGHNYRYTRDFRTVKKVIEAGTIGDVGFVTGHYYRVPHDIPASLGDLTYRVLWGMGIHHFDAFGYVLGQSVTSVDARSFTLPWSDPPDGASMTATMEFASGTHAMYSATYESRGHEYFGRGQEFYARFMGNEATLHLIHRWLWICLPGKLPKPIFRGPREVTEESILLDQLTAALTDGTEPACSGRDNLQTMALVEAFKRSAETGGRAFPQELLAEVV